MNKFCAKFFAVAVAVLVVGNVSATDGFFADAKARAQSQAGQAFLITAGGKLVREAGYKKVGEGMQEAGIASGVGKILFDINPALTAGVDVAFNGITYVCPENETIKTIGSYIGADTKEGRALLRMAASVAAGWMIKSYMDPANKTN